MLQKWSRNIFFRQTKMEGINHSLNGKRKHSDCFSHYILTTQISSVFPECVGIFPHQQASKQQAATGHPLIQFYSDAVSSQNSVRSYRLRMWSYKTTPTSRQAVTSLTSGNSDQLATEWGSHCSLPRFN